MKTFNTIAANEGALPENSLSLSVELSIDDRIKSRIIATTKDGQEVGIVTERGTTLHDGTILVDGQYLIYGPT